MRFDAEATEQFQLSEVHSWIPQFGVSYALGVDGIALSLIVMAAILVPVCLLAAWNDVTDEGHGPRGRQVALMLVLAASIGGVFAATDVFLFYVFFEAMLIPVHFLIGLFGCPRRQYAAAKFLLFSLAGGLVMLVSVIATYVVCPGGTTASSSPASPATSTRPPMPGAGSSSGSSSPSPSRRRCGWSTPGFLDAATEALPATAVLLVGILDKVGTYGMLALRPAALPGGSPVGDAGVITLAVVSIIYGALLAIGQTDMMRLIAFTSISHFGLIVLGIFALTTVGGAGSTLYMVNDLLHRRPVPARRFPRLPPRDQADPRLRRLAAGHPGPRRHLPGRRPAQPGPARPVLVRLRVPRPPGHVHALPLGEAVIAAVGIVLAALYILLMYQRVMTGPEAGLRQGGGAARPVPAQEHVVAPIIASFVLLGFYPQAGAPVPRQPGRGPDAAVYVGVTDPAPANAPGSPCAHFFDRFF